MLFLCDVLLFTSTFIGYHTPQSPTFAVRGRIRQYRFVHLIFEICRATTCNKQRCKFSASSSRCSISSSSSDWNSDCIVCSVIFVIALFQLPRQYRRVRDLSCLGRILFQRNYECEFLHYGIVGAVWWFFLEPRIPWSQNVVLGRIRNFYCLFELLLNIFHRLYMPLAWDDLLEKNSRSPFIHAHVHFFFGGVIYLIGGETPISGMSWCRLIPRHTHRRRSRGGCRHSNSNRGRNRLYINYSEHFDQICCDVEFGWSQIVLYFEEVYSRGLHTLSTALIHLLFPISSWNTRKSIRKVSA